MRSGTNVMKVVMNKKQKELDQATRGDKVKVARVLKDFVVTKGLLVYGGVALNAILPKNLKFYKATDFPDYDCMSANAKQDAIELADAFYKAGFVYTEVREAIHEGTFKVFVDFEAVADITQVRPQFFETMKELGKKLHKKDMNVAPLYYMKHSIVKELARPDGSYYRWPKVYQRSKLLDKIVTFDGVAKYEDMSGYEETLPQAKEVADVLLKVIKMNKLPLVGWFALKMLLGKGARLDEYFSIYQVLSMDPSATFEIIKKQVVLPEGCTFVTSKRFFYQEVLPKRLRVFLKIKGHAKLIRVMTILNTQEDCFSVVKKGGLTLGSPYTILQYMYAYWLVYYAYEPPLISQKVEVMIAALERYIHSVSPGDERFSLTCFGHQKTLKTVRKERWNSDDTFVYRPKVT